MSVVAMAWALDARASGPMPAETRLVLVALADYTDHEGKGAYPSRARLAERLGVTERSVSRSLAALVDAGTISHGDQELVSHYPANRRPRVYDLALGCQHRHVTAVTPDESRGDSGGSSGVTALSPNTRTKPTTKPPLPPTSAPARPTNPVAVARAANGQRPDGTCRRCDEAHPAGTSCRPAVPAPPNLRQLAEQARAAARALAGAPPVEGTIPGDQPLPLEPAHPPPIVRPDGLTPCWGCSADPDQHGQIAGTGLCGRCIDHHDATRRPTPQPARQESA